MTTKKTLPIYAKGPKPGAIVNLYSEEAFHLSVGSILGDGGIHKKSPHLAIEQASPTYTKWKWEKFHQCGLLTPNKSPRNTWGKTWYFANRTIKVHYPLRVKVRKAKKGSIFPHHTSFAFTTRAVYYGGWRDLFYTIKVSGTKSNKITRTPLYRKRIPPNIAEYFWGDLALAIWFLDDGWYDWKKQSVRFSAKELPMNECQVLKDCLKSNFNLDARIYTAHGVPHHLYLENSSYMEFYKRVAPYILGDLQVKYPRYHINTAMKNKVIVIPVPKKIGRPPKSTP